MVAATRLIKKAPKALRASSNDDRIGDTQGRSGCEPRWRSTTTSSARAQTLTGLKEKSRLVREALKALIERESARRFGAPRRQRAELERPAKASADAGMILVDTSIWVIISGLATRRWPRCSPTDGSGASLRRWRTCLGRLRQRSAILTDLSDFPAAVLATDAEVLRFITRHALYGRGIGYIDVHLLTAACLTADAKQTKDKRLNDVAEAMGLTMAEAEKSSARADGWLTVVRLI